MVWPHLKVLWHDEDNSAWDSERSKKERKGTIWGSFLGRLTSIFESSHSFFFQSDIFRESINSD